MSVPTTSPGFYVEAPDVAAPRGGLLDVAPITELADPHAALGPIEYVTADCEHAGLAPGMCCSSVPTDEVKTWEAPQTVCGGPYAVYKGVGCDIFGEPYTDQAQAGLERGQGFAVESAFFNEFLLGAQVLADGVCPAEGIGILEQYLGTNYAGAGMMHTSRFGATILGTEDLVFPGMDSPLTTILGTPVSANAGVPSTDGPLAPTPNTFWVYATGHVQLWRTPVRTYEARDTSTNESFAIAERVYSATVECVTVAVRVVVPTCEGRAEQPVPTPVITSPADGETVPQVHDVLGTAAPGSRVELWTQHPTGDGTWSTPRYVSTTQASLDGQFGFTGDTPARLGQVRWRVSAAGQWSEQIEITVVE